MVISSSYLHEEKQADGRYWVHEIHILTDGSIREMNYLADADADIAAIMAEHANDINSELANPNG